MSVQIPADILILALTYSLLLDNLPFRRALLVSVMVAAGLAAVLFLTTYLLSSLMPISPPTRQGDRLRDARAAVLSDLG